MRQAFFTLHIPAAEMLRYYRGSAATVAVTAEDGTRLKFPAASLRRFVTGEGIHGRFVIRFDEANRLVGIEKLSA